MARDRANINTAIWTDDDYRELNVHEQHMYKLLMTHPDTNYVGVVDWRPGRIAAMTAGETAQTVRAAAESLQAKRYVLIDDETEEILVRSFLRWDGLLKQPKLSISMVNAFGSVASKSIREVVRFELYRLFQEFPDWAAFKQEKVLSILKGKRSDIDSFTQGFTHSFTPGFTPNAAQGLGLRTATATTTSTSNEVEGFISPNVTRGETPGQMGFRIPPNFTADASMIRWAQDNAPNVNVKLSTQKFKSYHRSVAGRAQFKTDWVAAWESWLLSDQQRALDRPQQFKTTAEKNLEAGAKLHQLYTAQQDQQALEGTS